MGKIKASLAVTIMVINTVLVCIPLSLISGIKIVSSENARRIINQKLDRWIMDSWVGVNRKMIGTLKLTNISIDWNHDPKIDREKWYLVISNHQSWTDIIILQICLLDKIPPIKFFTKRQLIWIPFLGVALRLLGFPFVRRTKKLKNRELKSDKEITLEACERFQSHPTSILSFLEGTRYTSSKQEKQQGEYEHLLKPKIAGLSYVTAAMGEKIHKLVDVTIVYPSGTPTFWSFLQGECPEINLQVKCHDLPVELFSVHDDKKHRRLLSPWINMLWKQKDAEIDKFKNNG